MGARFQVVETLGQKLTYQQASAAAALLTHNGINGRLAVLNTQEKYNTAIATLEEFKTPTRYLFYREAQSNLQSRGFLDRSLLAVAWAGAIDAAATLNPISFRGLQREIAGIGASRRFSNRIINDINTFWSNAGTDVVEISKDEYDALFNFSFRIGNRGRSLNFVQD